VLGKLGYGAHIQLSGFVETSGTYIHSAITICSLVMADARKVQYKNQPRRLNEQLLKLTLSNIPNALSFLHDEAKVVLHTGKVLRTLLWRFLS
jgi:hypothetical protein